jgi:hypothetical protein
VPQAVGALLLVWLRSIDTFPVVGESCELQGTDGSYRPGTTRSGPMQGSRFWLLCRPSPSYCILTRPIWPHPTHVSRSSLSLRDGASRSSSSRRRRRRSSSSSAINNHNHGMRGIVCIAQLIMRAPFETTPLSP